MVGTVPAQFTPVHNPVHVGEHFSLFFHLHLIYTAELSVLTNKRTSTFLRGVKMNSVKNGISDSRKTMWVYVLQGVAIFCHFCYVHLSGFILCNAITFHIISRLTSN